MDKMRTAVIGVGNMGIHHARVLSEISNLAAVADTNEPRLKEVAELHKCKSYTDYNEMMKRENIDAVSIVVPTSMHKKVTLDVLRYNKPILLEKPLADNMEDARAIYSAVKDSGIRFTVGHVERFNPAVAKLKEILKNGELGDILGITARRVGTAGSPIVYGNIMIDLAIHDIDIINFLLDRKSPDKSLCFIGKSAITNREDYADIILRYGPTNAMIHVNWITPIKIRVLSINGSKAYAELNYITQELKLYKMSYTKQYNSFGEFILNYSKVDEIRIDVEKDEPLKLEIKSFLDCIKNGRQQPVTIDQSLDALEIALRLLKENGVKEVL
ncbi:Gfo/Idh/MocA family oxidoreductase [Candidatus Woesearchaeota archaeon]|nr:Gfo/Idh/MocA family oxidoreductase [Candidatus Woesearchaeota archaeon]